jgi:DNA-binding NtrC family response regulator
MAGGDLPSFHGIIGRSAAMQALFRRIERVAPIDVSVLIRGESGTGKELVAAAIQRLSVRRDRRFVPVNCGALPRELLLSELFGHERGAFTGAVGRTRGLLAAADAGTLFLDEIGELPLEAQVMLLRFLQQGEVRAVGSTETSRVNVRIIAATHRDLEVAIERGAFREDLYYRLRRVVLEVPPLRERRDDVPILVEHLRRAVNARHGLTVEGVSPQALARLEDHSWLGNVRDLETVMEQAMIFQSGGWVAPEDLGLPEVGRPERKHSVHGSAAVIAVDPSSWTWPQREAVRIATIRGEVRRADLMSRCGISTESARRDLVALAARGVLKRLGQGRGVRYILGSPRSGGRARDERASTRPKSARGGAQKRNKPQRDQKG